jgi:predicted alpha/beta-fold hydrolase
VLSPFAPVEDVPLRTRSGFKRSGLFADRAWFPRRGIRALRPWIKHAKQAKSSLNRATRARGLRAYPLPSSRSNESPFAAHSPGWGARVIESKEDCSFRPAWWLSNRHLQTIWPAFFRRRIPLDLRRERFELPDGDFLDVDWVGRDGPIVIVLHGLQGSSESNYVRGLLRALEARGWRGALMHFRGCSGEANRMARSYHSGETTDIDWFARELRRREPNTPLTAVAYSLGGNVLLKWLGETRDQNPLCAATAVSIPFELGAAADAMEVGLARIYQWYLIRKLRQAVFAKKANGSFALPLTDAELNALRTFREFDGAVTAPLHGFESARDYYRRCSSRQFVEHIETPTLVLHSSDDPLMHARIIPVAEERSPHVQFEISSNGGHVGFVSGAWPWSARYWLEDRIPNFLESHI